MDSENQVHLEKTAITSRPTSSEGVDAVELALESMEHLRLASEELKTVNEEIMLACGSLEEQHDRYRSLFELAPDAYLVSDPRGIIREANRAAAVLLGMPRQRLIGKPLAVFVGRNHRPEFYEILNRFNVAVPQQWDVQLLPRRAQPVEVEVRMVRLFDVTGKTVSLRWLLRDTTERRRAELRIRLLNAELEERIGERTRQLEEALERERQARAVAEAAQREAERTNRIKDEFLATLSHELRTPLNPILGFAQLLRKGELGEAMVKQAIAAIERNCRMQVTLVEDLIDVSRIITGKLRLQPVLMEPTVAAQGACEVVQPAAQAKGIELVLSNLLASGESPIVLADPNRLQQVFWNLLSNAVKFTPRDGRVVAQLEADSEQVHFSVTDTGIGIAPEFMPHIFERLRQADTSSTRNYGGLGLGLAIVRHLVELHGGTIEAHSPGVGQGATFRVSLPRQVPPLVGASR